MEEHLRTVLLAIGCPVTWGSLGRGTSLPRITLQNVSGYQDVVLEGAVGTMRGRVQVDCYGHNYAEAKATARAVHALLSGYSGGPVTLAKLEATRDRPEQAGSDLLQRVSLDFAVNYRS